MTVTEAANALGVAVETIRKRIQRGDMRARRVGERVLLIPQDEVERWRVIGKAKPGPKPRSATSVQDIQCALGTPNPKVSGAAGQEIESEN